MVCLDTDFIVALLRKDERAIERLRSLTQKGETLTITPITACELFKGAYSAGDARREVQKIKDLLEYLTLLEFSVASCERFGKIYAALKNQGFPIGDLDTIIASLAMTHNQSLLTNNVKHFERISGLILESW